jgi:hypothetical protein
VVVLGAIMTILDATIVNVALPTLGRDVHTSIATIPHADLSEAAESTAS